MNGTHQNVTKYGKGKKKRRIPYLRVSAGPQRDEYVHRMIAEALLRRRLKPTETVDHKNRDSLDCDPRNIQVLSWVDHGKLTRLRVLKKPLEGIEGVDYVVILDGEKIFEAEKPCVTSPCSDSTAELN